MSQANELYAFHLEGKLLDAKAWMAIKKRACNYACRLPKKVYLTYGTAKGALTLMKWLPKDIRDKIEIVKYTPACAARSVCYPPSGRRLT